MLDFPYVRWIKKYKFNGSIGYGDSYLEFLFRHFKVFRPHAILNNAAGAVRADSGKGSSYCYIIGRLPILCLLGHLTGLLFCFSVRLFLRAIFKSVDFCSSKSSILLGNDFADINVIKELGASFEGNM